MLGFDALGRLSLGQLPGSSITPVFLTGKVNTQAKLRSQFSITGVLAGRINGQAEVRASSIPTAALLARSASMLKMRTPGGFGLSGKITLQAKARAPGGYALYARMAMMSSAMSSIHLEGTLSPPRLPLLLNAGSQYGASYWKGRD